MINMMNIGGLQKLNQMRELNEYKQAEVNYQKLLNEPSYLSILSEYEKDTLFTLCKKIVIECEIEGSRQQEANYKNSNIDNPGSYNDQLERCINSVRLPYLWVKNQSIHRTGMHEFGRNTAQYVIALISNKQGHLSTDFQASPFQYEEDYSIYTVLNNGIQCDNERKKQAIIWHLLKQIVGIKKRPTHNAFSLWKFGHTDTGNIVPLKSDYKEIIHAKRNDPEATLAANIHSVLDENEFELKPDQL